MSATPIPLPVDAGDLLRHTDQNTRLTIELALNRAGGVTALIPISKVPGGTAAKERQKLASAFGKNFPWADKKRTFMDSETFLRVPSMEPALLDYGYDGVYVGLNFPPLGEAQARKLIEHTTHITAVAQDEAYPKTSANELPARTNLLLAVLGWQGGTCHQISKEFGGVDYLALSPEQFTRFLTDQVLESSKDGSTLGVKGRAIATIEKPALGASILRDITPTEFGQKALGLERGDQGMRGVLKSAVKRSLAFELQDKTPGHFLKLRNGEPTKSAPAPSEEGPTPSV